MDGTNVWLECTVGRSSNHWSAKVVYKAKTMWWVGLLLFRGRVILVDFWVSGTGKRGFALLWVPIHDFIFTVERDELPSAWLFFPCRCYLHMALQQCVPWHPCRCCFQSGCSWLDVAFTALPLSSNLYSVCLSVVEDHRNVCICIGFVWLYWQDSLRDDRK